MKSHTERSPEYINPEQPTLRHTVIKLLDYKEKKKSFAHKKTRSPPVVVLYARKKRCYIFKISKKRKRESRILYTVKLTLSINITDERLSTCKDSEDFVSMMFKRTSNNQNDYRDLNRSTGSKQKQLPVELRLNKN